MDHAESAQKLIESYRIYYNFIREHGGLKKTPAEKANLDLKLSQNKIEGLIKLAHKEKLPLILRLLGIDLIYRSNA